MLEELHQKMREFYEERDWTQFHSPKNLVMDLSCEVAEIAEHFRWLSEEDSYRLDEKTRSEVRDEIGDAMLCLLRLARKLDIDLVQAAHDKLVKIGKKYPVEKCKGRCDKYTVYESDE